MVEALLDNDIVIKTCRYFLGSETLASLTSLGYDPTILASAKFVIADRLRKYAPASDAALTGFQHFQEACRATEPTSREIEIAAAFEAAAQQLNMELDTGESLLLAILIERQASLLLTGDKRAIRAIEAIASNRVKNLIVCIEQLCVTLNSDWGTLFIQERICADQAADTALTNSYACRSGGASAESSMDGLQSYIEYLRQECTQTMALSLGLPRRIS